MKTISYFQKVASEYFEPIILFALIGFLINWVAFKLNFFVRQKEQKKLRIRYALIGFGIYLFLFLFAVPLIVQLLIKVFPFLKATLHSHPNLFLNTMQVFTIAIITAFLVCFSIFQETGTIKAIWMQESNLVKGIKDAGFGILAWFISFPVIVCIDQIGEFLTYLIFGVKQTEQLAVKYLRASLESPYLLTIALFSILIAAPVLEELFFRGFVQTYLKSKLKFRKALILSSFAFALFHFSFSQGVSNYSLVLTLFVLALYLGLLYERRKSLIAPIALHMTFNSISVMRILLFST